MFVCSRCFMGNLIPKNYRVLVEQTPTIEQICDVIIRGKHYLLNIRCGYYDYYEKYTFRSNSISPRLLEKLIEVVIFVLTMKVKIAILKKIIGILCYISQNL